jgi:ATP/maltotriose-dependent transcriptional regulator MalT
MLDAASGDDNAMRRTRVEQLRIRMISGPDPMPMDAIRTEAQQALEEFTRSADDVGMSQASYVLAFAHLRAGRMRDLADVARRGLAHAERSGDIREQIGALWWVSLALVSGPTPVPDAIRSCEELLRSSRTEHAGVLSDLARLRAMVGEFEAARELIARARRDLTERLHVRRALTFLAHHGANVEVMAGDLAAAERILRPALELARDVGESDQVSQLASTLSSVLSGRGEVAEAVRFADIGRRHAPSDSVAAQTLWRVAAAKTVITDEPREAERLTREAVRLVPHEMLNLRADLHVELATALQATGRPEAALSAQRQAAEIYKRKRNLIGARRVHVLRADLDR